MPRYMTLAVLLTTLALIVAACGGGDESDSSANGDGDGSPSEIVAQVISSDLRVGPNRLSISLFDSEANLILGAQVTVRFLKEENPDEEVLKAELPAQYVALESSFVHEHDDGDRHTHAGNEIGLYIVNLELDSPGIWAAEVEAVIDGQEHNPERAHFDVLVDSAVPNVGDLAIRSEQLTLRDVEDIAEIDTANPPRPEMHDMTIAEAVDTGKPVVVAFSTPGFCVSQICGPVLDEVVVPLLERYGDRAVFIHVEPYVLEDARAGRGLTPVQTLLDWSLLTEPWVFVIDSDGRIAGRFEAIVTVEEVEAVLEQVLG